MISKDKICRKVFTTVYARYPSQQQAISCSARGCEGGKGQETSWTPTARYYLILFSQVETFVFYALANDAQATVVKYFLLCELQV